MNFMVVAASGCQLRGIKNCVSGPSLGRGLILTFILTGTNTPSPHPSFLHTETFHY